MLKVVAVESVGAFLDWGLLKDLLVPFGEQSPTMEIGKSYIVRIYVDKQSNRIAATTRLDRYLDKDSTFRVYNFLMQGKQEVELLICSEGQTDIGYKASYKRYALGSTLL